MLLQKRSIRQLLSAAAVFAVLMLTVCAAVFSVGAAGASDRVKENKNGVIRLECIYGEDNIPVASYAGFIVNNNLIATSEKAVKLDAEQILRSREGSDFHYDPVLLKYQVMIEGSNVPAVIAQDTTNNAFSLFRLSKAISFYNTNYKALPLGMSSQVVDTDTVYAIGYSTTTDNELQINEGTVSKPTSEVIEYTMSNPTEGFIGAPVINENGAVIGITNSLTNDGYKAVAIDCLTTFFNTFSYDYTSAGENGIDDSSSELSAESEASSEDSAESAEESGLTSEDEQTADEEHQAGIDSNTVMIIAIIGIGAVAAGLVVVMIILAVSRKKPQPAPVQKGAYPAASRPYQPQVPSAAPQPPAYPADMGSGETTFLSTGASETTMLGLDTLAANPAGVLINLKTGDRIIINKQELAIGKERARVDYCISDDSSVSRMHLKVRVRDGRCYIVDMGSKNGTFINGNRLTPNQEYLIRNGDRLDISLKKYEFRG